MMINFFKRRRPTDRGVADAVRRSLAEHARHAPPAEGFAEQVLAAAERGEDDPYAPPMHPVPTTRRRRALAVPFASAAAVLVVIAAVVLAVVQLSGGHSKDDAVDSPTTHPVPQTKTVTVTPPPTSPSATPSTSTSSSAPVVGPAKLTGVHILDLTFTSETDGWALASADCLSGSGTCTAYLHTTDGHTWISHAGPVVGVHGDTKGCGSGCATGIRFATASIGYVYGPDVLYLTTNGGSTWQRESGGATALESSDGNVVRVASTDPFVVQTAPNGSSVWTTRDLPKSSRTVSNVDLVRHASRVYMLADADGGAAQNIGGGTEILYRSVDDGASWSVRPQPCPLAGGLQRLTGAMTTNTNGDVAIECVRQQTHDAVFTISSNGGKSFTPSTEHIADGGFAGGLGGTYLLTTVYGPVSRTVDGGHTWSPVHGPEVGSFVGFESDTVARIVGDAGSVIWTTYDAGKTWSAVRF